ncbi:MAG TPA: hypothetical protein IAC04_01765 [Candidatus Coprenecus stercoravium]|uniref:DUF4829 domain-containing protein n=1 Tax=Candidatus Coprenecus stercoravium TaxID=2840735 RepID=A0A9D2GPH4_9BACT|nr:hypothetical protein [Candidatus Coprenecus stercoravium]
MLRAIILLVSAFVLATGCSDRNVREASGRADDFVNAYFSADFEKASALCTEDFARRVMESAEIVNGQPDSLLEEFMELAKGMNAYAGEIHQYGRDSVTVDYEIVYPGEIDQPMRNGVLVVRDASTGEWSVAGMTNL